jgi:hypothetical protein
VVPPGFPWRAVLALTLLTVALRLATDASRVDEYPLEGLNRGTVAEALRIGAPLWPSHSVQIPHVRGSLVISVLAVPCFALLGPTTFALRLTGIVFHVAGLLALVLLVHRQFGRRAAVLAGALLVLAPPALARAAVLSYGDHVESVPFICAAALLALAWAEARRPRPGLAVAAGAAIGLAITWHAQSRLAMAPLALVVALLAGRKLLARETFLALLPGVLLGLVPLWIGDWYTAKSGLQVFARDTSSMVLDATPRGAGAAWWRFWTEDLAHALQYVPLLLGQLTIALAAACLLGLLLAGRRGGAGAPPAGPRVLLARGGFLAGYVLAFSLVYAASRFRIVHETDNAIRVRYVLPVLPFVLLPIAVAAARLLDSGRRAAGWALAGPALALGGWGTLSTIDLDVLRHEPARRADVWQLHDRHFAWGALAPEEQRELRRLELDLRGDPRQDAALRDFMEAHADPAATLALVRRYDRQPEWVLPLRHHLPGMPGVADALDALGAPGAPDAREAAGAPRGTLVAAYRAVAPELRPYAGVALARELTRAGPPEPAAVRALLLAGETPFERACLARGFGMGLPNAAPGRLRDFSGARCAALLAQLDQLDQPDQELPLDEIAFGAGFETGSLLDECFAPSQRLVREFLAHAPPALAAPFAAGAGAGYRLRFRDPPAATLETPVLARLLALFPAPVHAAFRAGLGGADGPLAAGPARER